MGNQLSTTVAARPGGALDSYVLELGGGLVYEKSMGTARFLKTVKAKHRNGPVVVKIFIKPDLGIGLKGYHRRLKAERETLADLPNVYGYQTFAETERAGYLIRQWVGSNLYDRISTRPFLSMIEKKWMAFQILSGMRDARMRNIPHGDLKSENVLVTSWNWVLITDFSSQFKPVHLPEDDPSDFSFYFDTSGRRTCYIAPERFTIGKHKERESKVTEAMDVFSAGCVLAEMFLDGRQVFSLSQLFKYKAGDLGLDAHLGEIVDEGVRALVKRMMSLNPFLRPTFDEALADARDTVFPESFYTFFHHYIASLNEPVSSPFYAPSASEGTETPGRPDQKEQKLPSDADRRIDRLWEEWESVEPYLGDGEATIMELRNGEQTQERTSYSNVFPVVVQIPDISLDFAKPARQAATANGPALIILSIVCANIRNCAHASSKVRALDLLLALTPQLTDEAKLDRMVPYVVDMLRDDSALVRAASVRTLMQILMTVQSITPSNAQIFPEYIFPNVMELARDPEVSIRCMYAQCIVALAETGVRYLEMDQAMKMQGNLRLPENGDEEDSLQDRTYDAGLQDIQAIIQEELIALLVDSSSAVKRAVLQNIAPLCVFFGRQRTNDVLLSHMITFLNGRDWMLRYAFFDCIVGLAVCVGARSLEEYILPLMIQALSDTEEAVVARVLSSLTSLSNLSLFGKMRLWELMSATIGFLYHPNVWIKQGAAAFLASAAKHLPAIDVWAILYPSLRPLLRSDVAEIDEISLLSAIKAPLSRQVFDAAVIWATKRDHSLFWKAATSRDAKSRTDIGKESLRRVTASASRALVPRSDEDESQIVKLQQLGMTSSDEAKILSLCDYILKVAAAQGGHMTRARIESDVLELLKGVDVQLQQLGVRPTTVFLGSRPSESSSRPESARRFGSDLALHNSMRSSVRLPISPSATNSPGSPIGGLRMKELMSASSTSLNFMPPSGRLERQSSAVSVQSALTSEMIKSPKPEPALSSSPAGSNFSSDATAIRRMQRIPGHAENYKAPPAIGPSKTIAMGHLETAIQIRPEDELPPSGRSSPTPTSRPESRMRYQTPTLTTGMWGNQENGVKNIIEGLYHDNFRESIPEFGPRVPNVPVRRRAAARASFPPHESSSRRTDVTLVAHLTSHTGAVNGIAVAPDHVFFVTCSNDRTVQIWDTSRLANNVTSKPRHIYTGHHARVTCICMLENTHCFASAADDGSLHVVRVHVGTGGSQPKYGRAQLVREHRLEAPGDYITCMTHYNADTTSNLVYATTLGNIVVLDVRTMETVLHMVNPTQYGPISTLCIDRRRAWLVTGTLSGVLTLWDLRFGLRLRSWNVASADLYGGSSTAVHQCVLHPVKGRDKWIIVAVESHPTRSSEGAPLRSVTLEVWDVDKAALVEMFIHTQDAASAEADGTSIPALGTKGNEAEKNPASAIADFVASREANGTGQRKVTNETIRSPRANNAALPGDLNPSCPDVRAILVGTDFGGFTALAQQTAGVVEEEGIRRERRSHLYPSKNKEAKGFIITGCEDRKVRYWDLGRVSRSFLISGVSADGEKPTFSASEQGTYTEAWGSRLGAAIWRGRLDRHMIIGQHQQQLLRAHQDCITALACIDSPFRGGVISADRAGIIKVFKVDFN
ncbi:ARM repeat-containing protein [Dacryopinax primogenitus]|uniref:non-specific serine/threonine protein kinase n=1 Tax=Dacryopinax primogenitus (strain DJM 731) TaxID=1858805 RepID=M5FUM1_DACPD|nr:ARM repeat-containing protein [Dacryopinax primogenitus]EJU01456.1 ARM repeat-containing protein [Dacryopinax primogenitus]